MTYDITIPVQIGLFTPITTALVVYFAWLFQFVASHRDRKKQILLAILHMIIMAGGLLLTGFAKWLQ